MSNKCGGSQNPPHFLYGKKGRIAHFHNNVALLAPVAPAAPGEWW